MENLKILRGRGLKKILLNIMLLLIVSTNVKGQCNILKKTTYDSSKFTRHKLLIDDILFDAKLLALSEDRGFSTRDEKLNMIDKMKSIQNNVDSNFSYLIIKLYNSEVSYQKCMKFDDTLTNCFDFLLVFSYFNRKYYRISGFSACDYQELFLFTRESPFFFHEMNELFCKDLLGQDCIIDTYCYDRKYLKKKRNYRKKDCNKN